MRDDQYLKLQDMEEKLCAVVIQEVDPQSWPGHNKPLADITKEERGDRYWCKKNAAATLTLLNKVITLVERPTRGLPSMTDDDTASQEEISLDKDIASAERQAAKILEEFENRQTH